MELSDTLSQYSFNRPQSLREEQIGKYKPRAPTVRASRMIENYETIKSVSGAKNSPRKYSKKNQVLK